MGLRAEGLICGEIPCGRRARFQVVNNDERDGFACWTHLARIVQRMTTDGWVKVDRL